MLETLKNAWKVKEIRNKILFTILIVAIFRIGSVIPVPYINPDMIAAATGDNSFLCARMGSNNRSEIWRVNYATGVEECIVSDPERSFTTPVVSPDGEWILFTGESIIKSGKLIYRNTDIYVCKKDGSGLMQGTYHAADDLSPTWSRDGKHIYFISQRGNAEGVANIWRIAFQYY